MDKDFQTSFIPKRPIVEKRATGSRPISLFTILALLVFFAVIILIAGLYFYKAALAKSITDKQASLEASKNSFEPSKITDLENLSRRLRASSEVLSQHVTVSPIFAALSALTMKSVSYTSFDYSLGTDTDPRITVKMGGIAQGYRSVALQSDLYAKNKNIIDPVFSNLNLDDKGNVSFELDFSVDPSFVNYKQNLADAGASPAAAPAASVPAATPAGDAGAAAPTEGVPDASQFGN